MAEPLLAAAVALLFSYTLLAEALPSPDEPAALVARHTEVSRHAV